jgi:hypothetical protein
MIIKRKYRGTSVAYLGEDVTIYQASIVRLPEAEDGLVISWPDG